MDYRNVCALCASLLLVVLPLQVVSQGDLSLLDALEENDNKPSTTTVKPKPGRTGGDFSLEDLFNDGLLTTTTVKAPTKVGPKVPSRTNNPVKPKPAADDFDLADALDSKNDINVKDKNKRQGDDFSDSDLVSVSEDNSYKPDKDGRRGGGSGHINQQDDNSGTTAEVGTIAGIASAVVMALVGAVSSYISYQKKKLCFSIQQSLNVDMTKAENSEPVAATEPQVQQSLLEPANAEPPTEVKVVP